MHAPLCVHSLFIEGEALGEEESYSLKSLNLSGCRSIGAILKEDVKSPAPQQPGGTNDTEQGNAPESAAAKSSAPTGDIPGKGGEGKNEAHRCSLRALAKFLAKAPSLTSLDLSNSLAEDGMRLLAEDFEKALADEPRHATASKLRLTTLRLGRTSTSDGRRPSDDEASALAGCVGLEALMHVIDASTLTKLTIGDAAMKSDECNIMLSASTRLVDLNLSFCKELTTLELPPALEDLRLDECGSLTHFEAPRTIRNMSLGQCAKLTRFWGADSDDQGGFSRLKTLFLYGCAHLGFDAQLPDLPATQTRSRVG